MHKIIKVLLAPFFLARYICFLVWSAALDVIGLLSLGDKDRNDKDILI